MKKRAVKVKKQHCPTKEIYNTLSKMLTEALDEDSVEKYNAINLYFKKHYSALENVRYTFSLLDDTLNYLCCWGNEESRI